MNKQGFTLIELLAVIVILGIILGIAVPSVIGIIDKSKKDVHVKNAQILASSVTNVMASENSGPNNAGDAVIYTLGYLTNNNYLPTVKDPDGGTYNTANSYVVAHRTATGLNLHVQLDGDARDIILSTKEATDLVDADVGTGTPVTTGNAASTLGITGTVTVK